MEERSCSRRSSQQSGARAARSRSSTLALSYAGVIVAYRRCRRGSWTAARRPAGSSSPSDTTSFRSPHTRSSLVSRLRRSAAAGRSDRPRSGRRRGRRPRRPRRAFTPVVARLGVPGWYREHSDLDYEGLSGLPENWVYNTGDEESPMRRLVATLLSPLASAYVLVVALVYVVSRRLTIWWGPARAVAVRGTPVHAHAAALAALAVGLVCSRSPSAGSCPRCWRPSPSQPARRSSSRTRRSDPRRATRRRSRALRQNAEEEPEASTDPLSPSESSTASHLRNLRDGMRAVLEHPQGTASGTRASSPRGRGSRSRRASPPTRRSGSTRASQAWPPSSSGTSPCSLRCCAARPGSAAFAGVLLLALQTDVIGVHWLAVALWGPRGSRSARHAGSARLALRRPRRQPSPSRARARRAFARRVGSSAQSRPGATGSRRPAIGAECTIEVVVCP